MPLQWNISPAKQLVSLRSEGVVRFSDLEAYLQVLASESALPYRELFDARQGFTEMSESDALAYAGMMNAYATISRLGPCALIAGRDSVAAHQPLITKLMLTERPLRIFQDLHAAENWLLLQ